MVNLGNKTTTYNLEKFFPTKCPERFREFRKPNKDFMYSADPRFSPSKAKEKCPHSHDYMLLMDSNLLIDLVRDL